MVGNCGHAPAPLGDPNDLPDLVFGYHPSVEVTWSGTGAYLEALARARPAVNVATLVGQIALRLAVLGRATRQADAIRTRDRAVAEPRLGLRARPPRAVPGPGMAPTGR